MKLLHTSDWHLGATEGERTLEEDQLFFIDEICQIIREEQVDAVLLAGDVYDRALAGNDAMKLYDLAMTRICKDLHTPVLSIAGNHDGASQLASCNRLLENAGLHVSGALTAEPTVVTIGNADIYLLPWFTVAKVKSLYPEEADGINNITDAFRLVCDKLCAGFDPAKKHIAVSHAFISDSETSTSDRAAEIGFATQVSADVFEGFDYVALGHIHKPQDVNSTIRYSGTPMIFSFGKEEKQEKSVTIIDTETMERKIIPLPLLHKWTTIEDTLDNVLSLDYPKDVMNGYVRIHVTDSYLGYENTARIKTRFAHALDISGRAFSENSTETRMSLEEFRRKESSPSEIFSSFCTDVCSLEVDEHWLEMFNEIVEEGEDEE